MFDKLKNMRNRASRSSTATKKLSPEDQREKIKQSQEKARSLKQTTRPPLTFPVTNLFVQRSGTRLFKAAAATMQGFPQEQDSQMTCQPRLGGRHDFLFSVLDGHNGATASTSLKGLIEGKFAGLKMTNENVTKAFLWFDQQYNSKTMFRDGTTCCMVHGQPWNALTDERVVNLEKFLQSYDPTIESMLRDDHDRPSTEAINKNRLRVVDPSATFPDDFVIKLQSINIGHSKAMLIRPNGNWISITEDHTPNNRKERNRILKAGGVIVEGKINGRHPVTRSIGDKLFKKLDNVPLLDQMVVPLPDFEEHIMLPGDLLLMSCDGLFQGKNMDFSTVAGLVADSVRTRGRDFDPAGVLRDIFEVSLEQGSRDNHSAVLLQFTNGLNFLAPPLLDSELIPGPLPKMQGIDKEASSSPRFRYVKSYVADLMRSGYTLDDVYDYHKARRDLDQLDDQDTIRPIIFKGDIAQKIAAEEEEKIAQQTMGEYVDNDSKFQYDDTSEGEDPRQTLAQKQQDQAEDVLRQRNYDAPGVLQNEALHRAVKYEFQRDAGSMDNKTQRAEFDLFGSAGAGGPKDFELFKDRAPSLTEYPPESHQTRSFFQQLRDSVTGRKH